MNASIDLRSDTVTQPTAAMREAMCAAPVGDDVYGEDPTVIALEQRLMDETGMAAAVFCPSGTQSNLMALMAHCERGDEYIVGQTAHTYLWEGGGAAVLGSIQPQPLDFEADGTLNLNKVYLAIKPANDHHPKTQLLALENTVQGKVLPLAYLKNAHDFCRDNHLRLHLDGARIFNAAVALDCTLSTLTQYVDSISVCLSKGLGAPVGSVLCGDAALIKRARRWRKVLGGGMRQAGILAAAGLYALDHHIARLSEDHAHAFRLAEGLKAMPEMSGVVQATNIVAMNAPLQYALLYTYLKERGILFPSQPNKAGQLRLVTHLGITTADIETVLVAVAGFYNHEHRMKPR